MTYFAASIGTKNDSPGVGSGGVGHAAMILAKSVEIAALFAALRLDFCVFFGESVVCSRPSGPIIKFCGPERRKRCNNKSRRDLIRAAFN